MREVKLPSGAVLKIGAAPFAVAKALYQAVLNELKAIQIDSKTQVASIYKDLFCVGFSSKEIEACLWECFKKCTYNDGRGDLRIDDQTFEPIERRDDYMQVCMEVAKENILPFGKSLYAEYQKALTMIEDTPK